MSYSVVSASTFLMGHVYGVSLYILSKASYGVSSQAASLLKSLMVRLSQSNHPKDELYNGRILLAT